MSYYPIEHSAVRLDQIYRLRLQGGYDGRVWDHVMVEDDRGGENGVEQCILALLLVHRTCRAYQADYDLHMDIVRDHSRGYVVVRVVDRGIAVRSLDCCCCPRFDRGCRVLVRRTDQSMIRIVKVDIRSPCAYYYA